VLTEAPDTITLEPDAVRLAVVLRLVPTTTVPKLWLFGVTDNCPLAVPVPDSETVTFELEAFDMIDREPVALPADCGV
jgi:hypothetical protein